MTTPSATPVPSKLPQDLLFNAERLDQVLNTEAPTYTDRLGIARRTVAGAVALAVASAESALDGLGYLPPVAYASGLSMTSASQTVTQGGVVYAPKLADLPFTTSGTFETAKFRVVQGVTAAVLAQPTGASGVGYKLNATDSADRTVADKLDQMPWVDDMIQPGDTSIHQAFARAVSVGGYWQVGPGPFTMDAAATIGLGDGVKFRFHGTVINHAATSAATFEANDMDDWALLGALTIVGDGKTAGTAAGVKRSGGNRFYVENVICREISGWGFYEINGTTDVGARGDQGNWVNCRAYDCYIGREDIADTSTEYNLWLNFTATGCGIANITRAGNNLFVSGNIVDNDQGVWVRDGANHAHGAFVGVNINHNGALSGGWNIRLTDVVNGETFTGCHVYGDNPGTGVIWLERSKGMLFTGGILDASIFTDDATGYSMVSGNFCPDSINTQGAYGAAASKIIVKDNFTREGMWKYNNPGTCFVRATRSGSQAISNNVATTLIFNAESYDTRAAHNASTGAFTLPWLGNFKVYGCARVTGASIPTAGGFMALYIDGVAVAYAPLPAQSAGMAIGAFSWVAGGAAGAIVEVKVTLAGTSLVLDTGSQLNIEEVS